jgi:hypothetical protein
MRLSEAIELLESEGLLLERIKKYRTTPEERRFRDNRSSTDEWSLREKLHKIANENGLEPYCNSISVEYPKGLDQIDIEIDFRGLSSNEADTLKKIASSLGISYRGNTLCFVIPIKEKQSQWRSSPSVLIAKGLKDAFNVPTKTAEDDVIRWTNRANRLYRAYKADDIVEADSYIKEMYDRLEEWVEKEQYGGIQNLTYDDFRDTVYDALDDYDSEKNKDKFITNQYGRERRINKMYYDFSKFCRIFSRELNRQRGAYRPQA